MKQDQCPTREEDQATETRRGATGSEERRENTRSDAVHDQQDMKRVKMMTLKRRKCCRAESRRRETQITDTPVEVSEERAATQIICSVLKLREPSLQLITRMKKVKSQKMKTVTFVLLI